jgi:hypothetical protein
MSKTRDTGFLGNVVKYDANGNVTVVNGATTLLSVSSSGQLTVPGDEVITGSLTVLGGITGAITGSATSASYAANASLLNGSGSGEFVPTGSFNTFSSSVLTYTGSVNSQLSALQTTSGSNITRLGALEVTSGSNITRLSSIESTTGSLNTASGSAITRLNALEVTSGSNITRLSALETASGSAITRLNSIESKTGSYATTGSNTFDGGQYLSSSFNPTGFSTTASLYTDGGLRVTKDAYISGTLYLNNVTVFGTQSVAYISSSQLNIGTNLITVNTDTPSIRFGGLAVYDSGSTGLTGSLLWDSQNNHWVYSNPSGSSYSGGMFISGPRTSTLGSETGTTSCMLMAGQGGDHITSSMIYHSSTVTCIPNTLIGNTICGTTSVFGSGAGTCINITTNGNNGTSESPLQTSLNFRGLNNNLNGQIRVDDISGTVQIGAMQFYTWNSGQVSALTLCHNSTAVFYGTVSAPKIYACTTSDAAITIDGYSKLSFADRGTEYGTINASRYNFGGESTLFTFQSGNCFLFLNGTNCLMFIGSNGNVGMGTTNPSDKLTITDASTYTFNIGAACGGAGAVLYTLGSATLTFATCGKSNERLRITSTGNVGIGTCTPVDKLQVLGSLRWGGSTNNVVSSNDASGVYMEISGTSTATRRLRLQGINDAGNKYSQFFINAGAGEMCFVTEDVQRLLIGSNGVANFSNIVCANSFSTPGFLRVHNTMKTFAISKNFGERQTNADYFRISSSSGGFQVMVYSVAQNVGVGWTQSQLFQAASAPYWGGWLGSSSAISTIGSGAGFISTAAVGNDGTITFRVTTGDNGTNTTGTILSYIQVTAFSIDNISFTAL